MNLVREMTFLVVLAAAVGICVNLFHPRGYELRGRSASRAAVGISVEEAVIKHDAGAIFVDARESSDYEQGRVPGALSVPLLDASAGKADLSFLDNPREIVIYCDGAGCGASIRLAEIIRKKGYRRTIYVMEDGYPGWVSHGGPVERKQ